MRRDRDHGLYGLVFAIAILLLLIVAWQGYRRFGRGFISWRPPIGKWARPADDGRDRAPSSITPLRLDGKPAEPRSRPSVVPPSRPRPPITPDVEDK